MRITLSIIPLKLAGVFCRLLKFPIELVFCLLYVLSYLLDCDCGGTDFKQGWLLISCLFLYVVRTTAHRRFWYILTGIVCFLIFTLQIQTNILKREIVIWIFVLSLVCLVSSCKKEKFLDSYLFMTSNLIKSVVCSLVFFLCLSRNNTFVFYLTNVIFVLLFCLFQGKPKEEKGKNWLNVSFYINIIFSILLLLSAIVYLVKVNREDYFYFFNKLFFCHLAIIVLIIHIYLITNRLEIKPIKKIPQILNILVLLSLAYYTIYIISCFGMRWLYVGRLATIGLFTLLHYLIFIRKNGDLKKTICIIYLIFSGGMLFYFVRIDVKTYILKEEVYSFAKKYNMMKGNKKYGCIRRNPPAEAVKDPHFEDFMEQRKWLYFNDCIIFDIDPEKLKLHYSVRGDSVIVSKKEN